jgi:hypothetical protein
LDAQHHFHVPLSELPSTRTADEANRMRGVSEDVSLASRAAVVQCCFTAFRTLSIDVWSCGRDFFGAVWESTCKYSELLQGALVPTYSERLQELPVLRCEPDHARPRRLRKILSLSIQREHVVLDGAYMVPGSHISYPGAVGHSGTVLHGR